MCSEKRNSNIFNTEALYDVYSKDFGVKITRFVVPFFIYVDEWVTLNVIRAKSSTTNIFLHLRWFCWETVYDILKCCILLGKRGIRSLSQNVVNKLERIESVQKVHWMITIELFIPTIATQSNIWIVFNFIMNNISWNYWTITNWLT